MKNYKDGLKEIGCLIGISFIIVGVMGKIEGAFTLGLLLIFGYVYSLK